MSEKIEKLNDSWLMLRYISFDFENEIVDEYLCAICKKLIVYAHKGPCGCKYCLECIKQYLDDTEKYCPGETESCNKVLLVFSDNVHVDKIMNDEILELIVRCPEKYCKYKGPLKMIPEHVRMSDHQQLSIYQFEMLERVSNLTNEVASLKKVINSQQTQLCQMNEIIGNCEQKLFVAKRADDKEISCEYIWNNAELRQFVAANINKAQNNWISSEPFFTKEGYKMRLNMTCGCSVISVSIDINPGPSDQFLQWPFIDSVTIEVINKSTARVFKRATYKQNSGYPITSFNKPVNNAVNGSIIILRIAPPETKNLESIMKELSIKCTIRKNIVTAGDIL